MPNNGYNGLCNTRMEVQQDYEKWMNKHLLRWLRTTHTEKRKSGFRCALVQTSVGDVCLCMCGPPIITVITDSN